MKKLTGLIVLAFLLCAAMFSCKNDEAEAGVDNTPKQFTDRPSLTLRNSSQGLMYTITRSEPRADSYDIYYIKGEKTREQILNDGFILDDANMQGKLQLYNINDGDTVSAVAAALKTGFQTSYSSVSRIQVDLQGEGGETSFSSAPVLSVSPAVDSLVCVWTSSNPAADSYDIYYRQGTFTAAAEVKAGTKLADKISNFTITGLSGGQAYSVVVTANKQGYDSVDSAIRTGTPGAPGLGTFTSAPSLTVNAAVDGLVCSWTSSSPLADNYELYWRQGTFANAEDVKLGTKIQNPVSGSKIEIAANVVHSVIVTANRAGYNSIDSAVKTGTPGDVPVGPPQAPGKSVKRGVGYSFRTLKAPGNQSANQSDVWTAKEMDLLMSGTGICWFYNWGVPGGENTVEIEARNRGLEFAPMAWNAGYNATNIKNYAQRNPSTKYLLAFNEPNFPDQSNMSPQAAANAWPNFRDAAQAAGLKIISPAMNYAGSGPYQDPIKWLDEFRGLIGEEAWDEIDGISVHQYAWWPNVVSMGAYRKYNKKLWLTEFCGWEDIQNREPSPELQAWYLSQALVYLEADPLVERYAWYLPKGHVPPTDPPKKPNQWGGQDINPFHNLLTEVDVATEPVLTDLGLIFTHIPALDKSVWYSTGDRIDASQFMNSNLAAAAQNGNWSGSVLFRPVTDTDKSVGVLEIHGFDNAMWVEYQIEIPATKSYTLTLRYNSAGNTNLSAIVDGGADNRKIVNSSGAWDTQTIDLGNIAAGKSTLRLRVNNSNSGNCAINWLRVE